MWQFVSAGAGCGLLAVGTAGAVVWWYAASSYPSEQRAARQNPVGARSGPAVVAPPLSLGLASLESLTFLHCSRSAEPGPGPGGSSKTLPQTDHSANQPGSGPEQNGDTYYRFAAPSQAKPSRSGTFTAQCTRYNKCSYYASCTSSDQMSPWRDQPLPLWRPSVVSSNSVVLLLQPILFQYSSYACVVRVVF